MQRTENQGHILKKESFCITHLSFNPEIKEKIYKQIKISVRSFSIKGPEYK